MTHRIRIPIAIPRARLSLMVLVAALVALACGSPSSDTTSPDLTPSPAGDRSLVGPEWVLTELRGEAPLGTAAITLVVGETTAGGSSGCNLYGGTPVVTADTFRLDEIQATAMACEDARLMDQESDYLALLAETSAYELDGDTLVLETAGGETLVFRAAED